jgi:hypothetical protein
MTLDNFEGYGFIRRCWIGRVELWRPFWLLFVPGLLAIPAYIAFGMVMAFGGVRHPAAVFAFFAAPVLWLGFLAFTAVSVWRSAKNTELEIFGKAARLIVAGTALLALAYCAEIGRILLTQGPEMIALARGNHGPP